MEVILKATSDPPEVANGKFEPQRVRSEPCETLICVIDGRDRIVGNGCDFTVDLKNEVTRTRKCTVSKIVLPKLPTINPKNNAVTIVHQNGTASTTLSYGFYNITSFVNELSSKLGALFTSLSDGCIVAYDPKTRVVSIESVGGDQWFFDSACSFIQYGGNVHGFDGYPATSDPLLVGSITQYSSTCGLIYSKYITIKSTILQNYLRSPSRNSRGDLNIVASCSICQDYTASDFDSSSVYTGCILVEKSMDDSPIFTIAGRNFASIRQVDIQLIDEFGFSCYDVINISPGGAPSFSCCVWLTFIL